MVVSHCPPIDFTSRVSVKARPFEQKIPPSVSKEMNTRTLKTSVKIFRLEYSKTTNTGALSTSICEVFSMIRLWGFTRQPENSKRAHLSAPALQTTTKFLKKSPRETQKKERNCGGRGKKKNEILGCPTEEGPAEEIRQKVGQGSPNQSAPFPGFGVGLFGFL